MTSQPAIAKSSWATKFQLRKFDPQSVEHFRGNLPILGKQTNLFPSLGLFVEHLQLLAPSGLLLVIDLPQIKDRPLGDLPGAQPTIFHHAPVAMYFTVFLAWIKPQEHSATQNI